MIKRAQGLIPWALFCVLFITGVTEFSIWAVGDASQPFEWQDNELEEGVTYL